MGSSATQDQYNMRKSKQGFLGQMYGGDTNINIVQSKKINSHAHSMTKLEKNRNKY